MLVTRWRYSCVLLLSTLLLYAASLNAFTIRPDSTPTGSSASSAPVPVVYHPAFDVTASLTHYALGEHLPSTLPGLTDFAGAYTRNWQVAWDDRGNRPHLIQGVGIPLVPGAGNRLSMTDLGLPAGQPLDMRTVERLLREFIDAHAALFRLTQDALRLHPQSVAPTPGAQLWLVDFEVFHHGIPVRGARVFFRVNHGNIVQFGTELVGDPHLEVQPRVSAAEAVARVLRHVGIEQPGMAQVLQNGTLKIYPELVASELPGEQYRGRPGAGYAHRLVREVDVRRPGDLRTYRGVVDAHSGALLEFADRNRYADAQVSGGIYPVTNTDTEEVRPFPNITVHNAGRKVTDENGTYDYIGGLALARLRGPLVSTNDTCGRSFRFTLSAGDLAFGSSGGTDCETPGTGGGGNTHASRGSLYHLTRIKQEALGFLPDNPWLQSTLPANTNIRDECNAHWNGESVNFYQSGGGCSNTGEITAVMVHEWGHGMDENSGGTAPFEGASGEAVGDVFAFLDARASCIGPNFQPGVPCHNCASTGCTGVRDMCPFANLGPGCGAATTARPDTVQDDAGIDADRLRCPFLLPTLCRGPMGYECHIESYIASTAVWDLTQLLIAAHGEEAGWAAMKQIWYDSLFPSKSAYQVVSGGQCNPAATVDGCGASNWYTVFLAVDDDDGNLANGTPNGCRIWQAFNDHGIACGAQPPCQ